MPLRWNEGKEGGRKLLESMLLQNKEQNIKIQKQTQPGGIKIKEKPG